MSLALRSGATIYVDFRYEYTEKEFRVAISHEVWNPSDKAVTLELNVNGVKRGALLGSVL